MEFVMNRRWKLQKSHRYG